MVQLAASRAFVFVQASEKNYQSPGSHLCTDYGAWNKGAALLRSADSHETGKYPQQMVF